MVNRTDFLSLLLDERYVLLFKLLSSVLPLTIFIGSTRIPESLFTEIITISGIFLGFSVWVLSAPMPYSLDQAKYDKNIRKRLRESVRFLMEKRISAKDASDEEKRTANRILEDEAMMNKITEEFGSYLLTNFGRWITNIISGAFWIYIVVPFVLSIIVAMAGLLHEGLLSLILGIAATYFMFLGIINAIWEIMRLKTRFNLTEGEEKAPQ